MGRQLDLTAMFHSASPTTRREILKLAAKGGIAAPVLMTMLARDGVKPIAAAPARQEGTPVKGGTFVVTGHQEVATLSPDFQGASIEWTVITQIHNALLEQDEMFEWQPVLAEALPEISEDFLTYTFTLRQGVMFHNGEEFTSADVKYYYEWNMDPANATINGTLFSAVDSVDASDPYTVIVTLKQIDAAFFTNVAATFIPSSKHHQEIGEDAYKGDPIGTGPFSLEDWQPAASTTLAAFPDHFRGAPNFDSFRLDVVAEDSVRAIGLETGDADSSGWPLLTEDNLRFQEDTENYTTLVTSGQSPLHIPLNNKHPFLSDKRVRQALLSAIDRDALIADIFQGAAVPATSNMSPAFVQWYNPDVPLYPYDAAKAATLLEEAGWVLNGDVREKDGEPATFTCTNVAGNTTRRSVLETVQQYLAEVGVDMQIEEAPVATILEQMPKGEMDAAIFEWTYGVSEPDATQTLKTGEVNNWSQFENARVDELLAQGLLEVDPEVRAPIYKEIQAIVAEEVPFLFLLYRDWYQIFNNRVQGLPEAPLDFFIVYAGAYKYWIAE